ncbi:MAG: tricarballylate utilization 4Fe-4S protein TcuB [Rhodobacteraceae bacterium]|nr:tricarballylate utilization 4Fe-4S protein TcuB [Paracoccaceae bacterium]
MCSELTSAQSEAARQMRICNACRYCEGYCNVFPAAFSIDKFDAGELSYLANLCHNCRGCHYACQFAEPHEFALNIPASLAQVRNESWARFVRPSRLTEFFQKSAVSICLAMVILLASLLLLIEFGGNPCGEGFYAYLSHEMMVAIFLPAFLLPLLAACIGVRRFWHAMQGRSLAFPDLLKAAKDAGAMRGLSGGQGQGCQYESGDRATNHRRIAHHAAMYGFLLCLASTISGTILHYVFSLPAPYGLFSLPKLFGVPGGILLLAGTIWLAWLKLKSDRSLADAESWGGEMAFILLLAFISASGLALFAATGSAWVPFLLALHLGGVLTFFLSLPFTKMVHGLFRLAAILRFLQRRLSEH